MVFWYPDSCRGTGKRLIETCQAMGSINSGNLMSSYNERHGTGRVSNNILNTLKYFGFMELSLYLCLA